MDLPVLRRGGRYVQCARRRATLPPSTSPNVLDVWQAEVCVSIRGLPVLLDDQTAAHYCPVELGDRAALALGVELLT